MSVRDGTGPAGMGPMTGRGAGFCASAEMQQRAVARGRFGGFGNGFGVGRGMGRGCGRGMGRGFGRGFMQGWQQFREAPINRSGEEGERK